MKRLLAFCDDKGECRVWAIDLAGRPLMHEGRLHTLIKPEDRIRYTLHGTPDDVAGDLYMMGIQHGLAEIAVSIDNNFGYLVNSALADLKYPRLYKEVGIKGAWNENHSK